MSIRTRLVLTFSLLSIVILSLALGVGYFWAQDRLALQVERQLAATVEAQANRIDGWLLGKQKVLEVTAGTVRAAAPAGSVPPGLLQGYLATDQDLDHLYFASPDGKLVSSIGWVPPAGFDPRLRPWYQTAAQEQKAIFTEPYIDARTGRLEVSVAVPCLTPAGQLRGVLGGDVFLKTLVDNLRDVRLDGQGYAFLLDRRGMLLAYPAEELVGHNLFETDKLPELAGVAKGILAQEAGYLEYQENGVTRILAYRQIPASQWLLCFSVEKAVVFQALRQLQGMFLGIALLSMGLVVLVTFVVARRLTRPLQHLTEQVGRLAQGDLRVQAKVAGSDEFAQLAAGFNQMVEDLRGMLQDVRSSTAELHDNSSRLVDIAAHVAANNQELSATVGEVSATVQQISAGTEENASSTEQVSHHVSLVDSRAAGMSQAAKEAVQVSREVAREVREVSGLMEDVSQSIQRVAQFAEEVAASCQRSLAITGEAQHRSRETNEIIRKLNHSSKQINSIVATIRAIAEQTNMLALNATIEAAGAGEAGKGFAVVAKEVKELSRRTAEEAGRIAQQIEDMQTDMGEAVTVVGKIGDVVGETLEITRTIAAAVSEQARPLAEQAERLGGTRPTTISKEVAMLAGKSEHVAQNAAGAARGVEELSLSMENIARLTGEVADSTHEITAMMENIAEATQDIAKGTEDISCSIQEADKAINDTASKATKVSECAYETEEMANRLKMRVDKFKM